MNEHGMPCRKCAKVSPDVTVIYGRDPTGALAPVAAQCKGPCWKQAARTSPPAGPSRPEGISAIRPGKCAECTYDIVPGDRIQRVAEGRFAHFECAPADGPRPQRRDRTRSRGTTVQAQGVVV